MPKHDPRRETIHSTGATLHVERLEDGTVRLTFTPDESLSVGEDHKITRTYADMDKAGVHLLMGRLMQAAGIQMAVYDGRMFFAKDR